MKIISTLILFVITISSTLAQITVQAESIPEIGDVLIYTSFTGFEDTMSYRLSGENVMWTFDNFNVGGSIEEAYLDISGTAIGDTFPEANMLVRPSFYDAAAIRTDSSIDIIGILPGDFSGFGIETEPVFTEPFSIRKTPFNYGDSISDQFSFQIQFSSSLIPGLDTIEIPIGSLDSIRVTVTISKVEVASAWGNLNILDQDFDVLRIKQMDITKTTFEAGLSIPLAGFIWVDASMFIGDFGDAFNQQSTTYKFLTSDSKRSIVEFRETRIQDTVLNVTGRISAEIVSSTSSPFSQDVRRFVFPNPSNDYIVINSMGLQSRSMEVLLVDCHGKTLQHIQDYQLGNKINIHNLPVGQYYVLTTSDTNRQVNIISVIR